MSDSLSNQRADKSTNTHLAVVSNGTVVPLNRDDMYVQVRAGSGAISITTTPPSAVPIGLRVTFDNSGGSGILNVNSGEVQVPPGLVYEVKVVGDGLGGQTFVVAGPETAANTLTTYAALQAAIDNDKENGRLLELQVGETTLTSTLVIDSGAGGGLYGQGRPQPILQSSDDMRGSSVLVYTGSKAAGTPAIEYTRSDFVFQDLVIQGKTTAQIRDGSGTRTPRGIYLKQDVETGTGKMQLRNVRLSGLDVAIECGDSLGAANCDECAYYSVFSDRNGTFFRSNNIQGLSHKFYDLRVAETDTVFDYIAGGKMAVTDCFLAHECTLLQLRNDQSTGFGHNGSRWVFRGVDLDSQARNSYLLHCEPDLDYYGHVIFDGVHLSMNGADVWDNPGIHVGDNMVVVINNGLNIPANFVSWDTSSNESVVIFNNPKVYTNVSQASDIFKTSGSSGNLRCIVNMGFQYNTYALLNTGTLYNEVLAGI